MSKILFLSQLLPYPLDAGPKTRSYYVLRYLAQKHEVTLVCFVRPNDPPQALEHMRRVCPRLIAVPMQRSRWNDGLALARSLLSGRSWIIARDDRRAMRAALQGLMQAQSFDFIHADQLWMAQYALFARHAAWKNPAPRLVLDQHNAVFMIPLRMAENTANPLFRRFLKMEAQRLARYEVQTCRQFDHVTWVTHEDHQAVAQQAEIQYLTNIEFLKQPPLVIPICVDPADTPGGGAQPDGRQVLFVGGFHWPPNVQGVRWFIQEILPKVRRQVPDVHFTAVGKLPPEDFTAAEGVSAPGYVDDLEPYYTHSRAFVVPLLAGGGMRVKILDAWMRGLPVVSTRIGAEGIDYRDGQDIAIADSPEDFAARLVRLLNQDTEYLRLGRGGRTAVEARYDWTKIYPAWDQIYAK